MLHIVAHVDVDGIVCHAIVEMWARKSGIATRHYFVNYQNIGIALGMLSEEIESGDEVLIADIGYSKDLIDSFLGRYGKLALMVSWFDHHQWDREAAERVGLAVKELTINEKLCASEIVQRRFLPESEAAKRLACLARAHDFDGEGSEKAIFDHACMIQDVIASGYPKQAIVDQLSDNILWNDSFEAAYQKYQEIRGVEIRMMDRTIERHSVLINGAVANIVLVFASGKLEAKDIKRHLFEKNQCDAVIVVWSNGRIAHEVNSERLLLISARINNIFKGGGRGLVGGATYPESVSEKNRSDCFKEIIGVVTDKNGVIGDTPQ